MHGQYSSKTEGQATPNLWLEYAEELAQWRDAALPFEPWETPDEITPPRKAAGDKLLNYSMRWLKPPLARHIKQIPHWVVWQWVPLILGGVDA